MKNTVVMEIAVTVDGERDGKSSNRIGVRINPPPAPISVPNPPTTTPIRIYKTINNSVIAHFL